MKHTFKTHGTCSSQIILELDGDTIESVQFIGGCSGNSKGISSLVRGMKVDDVVERFQGITCGMKKTSCPDQLSKALLEAKQQGK